MTSLSLRYSLLGLLLSLTTLTPVHAGVSDGLFGDYFTNMIGYCPSTTDVVIGFSPNAIDYGARKCTPLSTILATLFA